MLNNINNLSIGLAQLEQADEIAQVVNSAYGMQFNRYIIETKNKPKERTSSEKVITLMSDSHNKLFVLLEGKTVKGTICYVKREKKSGYFGMFSLAQEVQKGGIGARMIDYVEQIARSEGKKRMKIDVSGFASSLHNYYGKHGYEQTGKTIDWCDNIHWELAPEYKQDPKSAFVIMKKTLL